MAPSEHPFDKLIGAMQWLLDDITDADEDKNPETGTTYDSVKNARKALKAAKAAKDAKPVKDELSELPDGELKCTCGREDFRYVEDIGCYREVDTLDDGVLTVDGLYKTEGYDDGENPRLQCARCCKEYAIPDDVEVKFE
jgi:hypothetical protein